MRQDIQGGLFRASIPDGDLDEHILGRGLGIFDKDIEIAILIKDASIQ
jgi:hypothetical protein